jgi:hypothetical protein
MKAVGALRPVTLAGLLIMSGCGSPTTPSSPTPPPVAVPSAVSYTVSPGGEALNSTTIMHYTGTATGSSLSYSWDFGDGGKATGQTTDHIFKTDGIWNVVLTVTNSAGSVAFAMAGGTTVRSLTGNWADPVKGNGFSWTFQQTGRTLTGIDTSQRPAASLVKGVLADPRAIQFEEGGSDGFIFSGTVEKQLDGIDLTYPSPDGPVNIRITRQ